MSGDANTTDREGHKLIFGIEQFLKYATPLGAVIVFLVGILHYSDAKQDEFRKTYWHTRYSTYNDLVYTASIISSTSDSTERQAAINDFRALYSGPVVLVEDHHVFEALTSFGHSLSRAVFPDSMPVLRDKVHLLGQACRMSLQETWEPVPLRSVRNLDK